MTQLSLLPDVDETPQAENGLKPWYVLLLAGMGLTGLFPWLMVSWALFQRHKQNSALVAVFVNIAVFLTLAYFALTIKMVWWWLAGMTYVINALWSLSAWAVQRHILGAADRRYHIREWKSWLSPLLIGAVLGICLALVLAVPSTIQNRMEMQTSWDSLDRVTILWDFLPYSFAGLVGGLLLGFWWAGEHRRFGISHVVTFLTALVVTIAAWVMLGLFLMFLIHKGATVTNYTMSSSAWDLIPPWIDGTRQVLIFLQAMTMSALVMVPLMFGAVSRIRDFGKHLLLIPLAFFCVLPVGFTGHEWWRSIQDQIFYEMSSPDPKTRASAHNWADILLTRYPNHQRWPALAEDMARYYANAGDLKKARAYYQQIVDRHGDLNKWHWYVEDMRGILKSPNFDAPPSGPTLQIPLVDYEEYLTTDWMALLSVIRYWEGKEVPESEIKIRLKEFSYTDDRIVLSSLSNLADMDDAARNLGYQTLIVPADFSTLQTLLEAGIPVIHSRYSAFYLMFGFDESRSIIREYIFDKLSYRFTEETKKDAAEILEFEEEGQGASQQRLRRLANETYNEHSVEYWYSPFLRYTGPLMTVVYPPEQQEHLATVLDVPFEVLKTRSDGYLATLISLSYLQYADPIQAIEWAKTGAATLSDPMPLYAAHLAGMLWNARDKLMKSVLPLQEQFSELAEVSAYFEDAANQEFLELARLRFEADVYSDTMPTLFLDAYLRKLDQSEPEDLVRILTLLRQKITIDPSDYSAWIFLANLYEAADDLPNMIEALQGAVSSNPLDSETTLRLAYGHVRVGQDAEAKLVLERIDPDEIRYEADYPFCLGAIAESEGELDTALDYYADAIEMRRHTPFYFLKYGKLLLQEDQREEARKALEWAAEIDGSGIIKREAEQLLSSNF